MLSGGVECREVLIKDVDRFAGGYICYAATEHAERIVRAVNSHDALVEALRSVRSVLFEDSKAPFDPDTGKHVDDKQHPWIPGAKAWGVVETIDAALALAEQS